MSNKSGTASQAISLPKGGGVLHGISEKFQPDLYTTTGNFSIPITPFTCSLSAETAPSGVKESCQRQAGIGYYNRSPPRLDVEPPYILISAFNCLTMGYTLNFRA